MYNFMTNYDTIGYRLISSILKFTKGVNKTDDNC